MKTWLFAGIGLALTMGGIAIAQTPPGPPPPPPPGQDGPQRGGPPEGWMHGPHGRGMGMRGHPPMGKAAFFRVHKGDQSVSIKCADDEPMKACVDAASVLLDKLGK